MKANTVCAFRLPQLYISVVETFSEMNPVRNPSGPYLVLKKTFLIPKTKGVIFFDVTKV